MNGNKLFLDTNIILYFLGNDPDVVKALEESEVVISFVSELELLSYPKISETEEDQFRGFLDSSQLVNINQEIKEITIDLKRKYKLKPPVAIIAASSYYFNLPLFTADSDFSKVEVLDVIMLDV